MYAADDKDDTRMEMLFSVAIIILLYFVIMQTFFQTKRSNSNFPDYKLSKKETYEKGSSEFFLNQIEEIYELQQ